MPATHTPIQPRYLTLAEAAVYCSLSEKTLRRAISRGDIAHYRPCRSVLVSVADLEAYLATTRVEAVDPAELAALVAGR